MSFIEKREGSTDLVFVVELRGRPFLAGSGYVKDKDGYVIGLDPPIPLVLNEPKELVNTKGKKVGSILVREG